MIVLIVKLKTHIKMENLKKIENIEVEGDRDRDQKANLMMKGKKDQKDQKLNKILKILMREKQSQKQYPKAIN